MDQRQPGKILFQLKKKTPMVLWLKTAEDKFCQSFSTPGVHTSHDHMKYNPARCSRSAYSRAKASHELPIFSSIGWAAEGRLVSVEKSGVDRRAVCGLDGESLALLAS
jgi:hypothetical protein